MPQRIEFEGELHQFPDDFTDADIAAALGETPAREASNPPTRGNDGGIVTALGGLAGAGMAAAPGVVAAARLAAPKVVPGATALTVANDLRKGDVLKAAEHGVLGTAAASTVGKIVEKATPYLAQNSLVARMAAALRSASPYVVGATAIMEAGRRMGQHERTLDPRVQRALRRSLDREVR